MTNDKHLFSYLVATAPPGVKVLLATEDNIFATELRTIYDLPLPNDLVIMASDGRQTWVVCPPTVQGPGLLVTFIHEGDGTVRVVPTLVAADAADYSAWQDADYSTQAVIDAWDSLCFRRVVPMGRVH